jgi:hypothetical protein
MQHHYLHNLKDFPDLLRIVEQETGILAGLVEKDYWIMHILYGLKKQGFSFEMKGGTLLSKGYGIIKRFSEDIDIQINPPAELGVNTNPKNTKPQAVESRMKYYDWLAGHIEIDGIISVTRDHNFDDAEGRSGGIRLHYKTYTAPVAGLKDGILLEAGFDNVTPNASVTISSWAYDRATNNREVTINDNRAFGIACYHPGYTFVEKLQTIATKFRQEQEDNKRYPNLMRQYYDIYSLLDDKVVQGFIGTEAYSAHKEARFRGKEKGLALSECEAFILSDKVLRAQFEKRYQATSALYYGGQPPFDALIARIYEHLHRL